MTLTIDSQTIETEELGLQTFGDVLSHIKGSNRLVTQMLIDGREPDLDHVRELRSRLIGRETIFIETVAPHKIARDVLNEISRQMDESEVSREAAIELLAENAPNKALQKLSGCFTAWQAAQQAIRQISTLLGVDLNAVYVEGISLADALTNFAEHLRSIRASLENRDYVTLSDTLSYEIGQTIRQWRDALTQLEAHVASSAAHMASNDRPLTIAA